MAQGREGAMAERFIASDDAKCISSDGCPKSSSCYRALPAHPDCEHQVFSEFTRVGTMCFGFAPIDGGDDE